MIIGGLQKTSFIDYPEKISAIIFTRGCNFACGYCHNPELFDINSTDASLFEEASVLEFLKTRIGKLDAVVITGGEPTLQSNLVKFIEKIKEMDYLIKLDSNGTNPKILEELMSKNLIDYIAMDIKAPISKYNLITNRNIDQFSILESINIIKNAPIGNEFRTTAVKSQLSFEDFEEIGKMISGAQKYYLQEFVPTKTLDKNFMNEKSYSKDEFEKLTKILKKYVKNVFVR